MRLEALFLNGVPPLTANPDSATQSPGLTPAPCFGAIVVATGPGAP